MPPSFWTFFQVGDRLGDQRVVGLKPLRSRPAATRAVTPGPASLGEKLPSAFDGSSGRRWPCRGRPALPWGRALRHGSERRGTSARWPTPTPASSRFACSRIGLLVGLDRGSDDGRSAYCKVYAAESGSPQCQQSGPACSRRGWSNHCTASAAKHRRERSRDSPEVRLPRQFQRYSDDATTGKAPADKVRRLPQL